MSTSPNESHPAVTEARRLLAERRAAAEAARAQFVEAERKFREQWERLIFLLHGVKVGSVIELPDGRRALVRQVQRLTDELAWFVVSPQRKDGQWSLNTTQLSSKEPFTVISYKEEPEA